MSLIKLGLAIAVVAGAYGLTVSAGDLTGGVDVEADAAAFGRESDLFGGSTAYERVEIPEAGLALEVPTSWQQLDQEPAWSPTGTGETRIAISWFHLLPSIKPEAILLPASGLIVASAPIALDWGCGRQYMVTDYRAGASDEGAWAAPLPVEIHTIVTVADGETLWAYDLHLVAPTAEEVDVLKPVLGTMLRSMYRSTPTAD